MGAALAAPDFVCYKAGHFLVQQDQISEEIRRPREKNMMLRRTAMAWFLFGLCAFLLPIGAASALDYPTRPVRFVVGYPAGGSTDILARLVGQKLSERLGQQFVIENKPGAGNNIGTESVVT